MKFKNVNNQVNEKISPFHDEIFETGMMIAMAIKGGGEVPKELEKKYQDLRAKEEAWYDQKERI